VLNRDLDGDEESPSPTGGGRTSSWSWWPAWRPAWWPATVAVALVTLAAALWLGGAASQPVPFGLPDAGPITKWGLPAARLLSDAAAMLVVGSLLAAAWLVRSERGSLPPAGVRCARLAGTAAAIWTAATVALLLLTLSDTVGVPVTQLDGATIGRFARDSSHGRALVFVTVIAAVIAVLAARTTRTNAAGLLLIYAYVGMLPPVFTGHAATASNHNLAVITTAAHILVVSTWVGGLVALVILGRAAASLLPFAVPRFSQLALYCYLATAVSGTLNAGVRLDWAISRLTTGYGGLLAAKTVALLVLGLLAWQHRRREAAALTAMPGQRGFLRVASIEALVMIATVGIAVALSRTPTP
jgi:putative copper export protein